MKYVEAFTDPSKSFRGDTWFDRASGFPERSKVAVAIPLAEIDSHKLDVAVSQAERQRERAGEFGGTQFLPRFYCMSGLVGVATTPYQKQR